LFYYITVMLLLTPVELALPPSVPPCNILLSPAKMFVRLLEVVPASYGEED
jgi:hypothetical protein